MKKLKQVIKKLQSEEKLNQTRYKPYKLYGNYEGCWECHVKDDWLLVWFFNEEGDLVLVRTGSHFDLFK
ncbi:MAG: type II toxin-antitoxin system YafQ family toxin [Candidatus Paceibacteria bacterium]